MMMTQIGYQNTLDDTQWVESVVAETARRHVVLDYPVGHDFARALQMLAMEDHPTAEMLSRVRRIGYQDQRQRRSAYR